MSNFSNLIDKYEVLLNKSKSMLMEGNSSISGYFKNVSLEIGVDGIDNRYLEDMLSDIEQYLSKTDEKELLVKRDLSEIIDVPGIKQWLTYYQVISHESFHLIQSLTLQAVSEYVYWIRQFRDYEFMAFAVNLSTGGYWKAGKDKSLLDAIPRMADIEFRDWIEKTILKNNLRLELLENYIEGPYGISTFDLVEGTAVAFQELVTHSVGLNIHNFSRDGLYKRAYQFYLDQGGRKIVSNEERKIVFLYIGYTSLYYGSASKLHSGSEWNDPVKIFIYLCLSIDKYKYVLQEKVMMHSAYNGFLEINKENYLYKQKAFTMNVISL